MTKVLRLKAGGDCWKIKTSTKIFLDPPGTTINCPCKYVKGNVPDSFMRIRCSCKGDEGLFRVYFGNLIDEN